MSTSDTSERGLERLICTALAGHPCDPPAVGTVADPPAGYGGVGWSGGNFHDYDREYCIDLVQLSAFLRATQPEAAEALALAEDDATRRAFLTRLQGEINKRGTIEVLRNGIKHGALHLDLFYGTPSAGNPPNPDGLAIDYLWREVLTRRGLTNILENYAQVVEAKDEKSGRNATDPDLAALPSARRGAPPAGRRRRPRRGQALPDPALGRQRQEQFHRLAGSPTDRAQQGRRAGLRLDHRGYRPGHPRPSDPRHDQAVRAGGGDGRARGPLGRSAPVHRERQEDHQPRRPHQRGHDAGSVGQPAR